MSRNYKAFLFLFTMLLMIVVSCSGSTKTNFFIPDEDGTITIINKTGEELVLYIDKKPVKKIHSSSYPFKVKLPGNIENYSYRILLWLFFYEDVKDYLENPQDSGKEVFTNYEKKEKLKTNYEIEIKKEDKKTGIITFYYNIEDVEAYNENIQLDIYNYDDYDPNKKPLLSLSPGDKGKLEVGQGSTHRFTYRYVAPDGTDYVIHLPNQISINKFNPQVLLETILPSNKQAILRITNKLNETITIFTEDFLQGELLIEKNIHLLNKENGISWINPKQTVEYQLEENDYCFFARNNKEEIVSFMEINIKSEGKEKYEWWIVEDTKKPEIKIEEPKNESNNVNTYTNIIFNFSQPMSSKVTKENIIIKNTHTEKIINGNYIWNTDFTQAIFTPLSNYNIDTKYLITVNKNVMSLSGKNADKFIESFFTTSPIKSQPNFITNPLIDLGLIVKPAGKKLYDKQLTLKYNADKGFFSTDYVFKKGDKFRLSFIAQESYSLFFLNINLVGDIGTLFPYKEDDKPKIKANKEYIFPGPKLGYEVFEPYGKDLFIIILSKHRTITKEEINKDLGITSYDIENIMDLGESLFETIDDLFISNRGDVAIYGLEVHSSLN